MPGYTAIINLLDYTAITIPVTTADKNIDVVDTEFKPLNEQDEEIWKSCKFITESVACGTNSLIPLQMIRRYTMEHMSRYS